MATLPRTVLGESRARASPADGVANVINNRSLSNGLYPAKTVDVALQPYQFSTYGTTRPVAAIAMVLAITRPTRRCTSLPRPSSATFIDGTMPDNTGGAYTYHVTGITNAWIQDLQANSPYGSVQIGNRTFTHSTPSRR